MARKDKREAAAFKKAHDALERTITSLRACNSYDRLQAILHSIDKAKKSTQSPYSPLKLTPHHQSDINRLKATIDSLIKEKILAFPAPVVPVVQDVPVEEAHESSEQSQHENNNVVFDETRLKDLKNVFDQMYILRQKIEELHTKTEYYVAENKTVKVASYRKAVEAGRALYDQIQSLCTQYARKEIDLDAFKQQSTGLLKNDNPNVAELKTHREYKDVLVNLLIALTGVGLLAIAAMSVYNGRLTMFKTNTDSGSKIDALKDTLEHVQTTVNPK
ncbi:hypothetical protein Lmor_2639 [Legionella moravica]|uniref:Uncharacterized protein n=1 Tax=Legionella moravica TaxID=39962 RepID=A0A378JUP3_9GAMM|nr:hypothetical protein [Legionella moravica]KTD31763.1 hypothetical protein Lmor_2639 [Legionella moravica]STX62156.1 Uncharacterised protein [Legionella moravica]